MSLSNMTADGSDPVVQRRPVLAGALSIRREGSPVRRLGADKRGAAAAEFALVIPAALGLLFGTFEFGIAFFSYATAQSAVRDVTRQVAVNTMPVANAQSAILSRLPNWARSGATVTVSQSSAANPATNVYTVVVSMPMSAATPLQFFTMAANQTLRTELRMKQEMPYVAIQ
jgi:Flp pilus assembly protein TadG